MVAKKAFKKGDLVTYIDRTSDDARVFYRQAVVYSCGMKRLVLTDENTGEEFGSEYIPKVAESGEFGVRPRLEGEALEAECAKVAKNEYDRLLSCYEQRVKDYPEARWHKKSLEDLKATEPRWVSWGTILEEIKRKIYG